MEGLLMDALAKSLGRTERDLLRETEVERMAALSEDELIDLHKRIRRARNKYSGIYRRKASAKVAKKGGRGIARPKNQRNAGRAEVFEEALSRVSARLAEVAAASAEELRAQRLAAASKPGTWPGSEAGGAEGGQSDGAAQVTDNAPSGPGRIKRDRSSQAQGARRQAKKDSR